MKFELIEHLITLNENKTYTKELNLVSWNDNTAKLDIRSWRKDTRYPSKGIALSIDEAK
jgi:hypothetical protein